MSDFSAQLAEVVERFTHDATDVDHADAIPRTHFDQLAALGLFGAFAPIDMGGLEFSLAELCDCVELLASACLASTFVWIQHFRLLAAALDPSHRPARGHPVARPDRRQRRAALADGEGWRGAHGGSPGPGLARAHGRSPVHAARGAEGEAEGGTRRVHAGRDRCRTDRLGGPRGCRPRGAARPLTLKVTAARTRRVRDPR